MAGAGANGPITLAPPNTASDVTVSLSLGTNSDQYCTAFGGAAGGTLGPNSATQLKARNPTSEPASCP